MFKFINFSLKFVIIFASKRKDKAEVSNFYEREKKFYDSAIQDYIIGNQDGLNISKQSKLTICSNSNLGYELLYTNHKVVFFCDSNVNLFYGNNLKLNFLF